MKKSLDLEAIYQRAIDAVAGKCESDGRSAYFKNNEQQILKETAVQKLRLLDYAEPQEKNSFLHFSMQGLATAGNDDHTALAYKAAVAVHTAFIEKNPEFHEVIKLIELHKQYR